MVSPTFQNMVSVLIIIMVMVIIMAQCQRRD